MLHCLFMQAHVVSPHHQFSMLDMVTVPYSLTELIAVVQKDHLMSVALNNIIQAHTATTFMM